MLCQNCQASTKMRLQPQGTELEGIVKIWCPTWFEADKGPILNCVEHALGFTQFNEHNRKPELFHFNEEAQDRFDGVTCINHFDDRYPNIKGMLMNGSLYKGTIPTERKVAFNDDAIVIVDGKAWYICVWHAINLGDFSEAKHHKFKKLLERDQD